ncbi:MAG: VIT domain-containing protein, partial [Candidatus Acidiferrum sp.]
MNRLERKVFSRTQCHCLVLMLLAVTALFSSLAFAGQSDSAVPCPGEGALLYRSPVSGAYETIPLTHTDVAVDVRGLVESATVTQQYVNSSSQPIEAVYVFPLPQDAAVYDMEIRVGNRLIRSVIREREEAKHIYEA